MIQANSRSFHIEGKQVQLLKRRPSFIQEIVKKAETSISASPASAAAEAPAGGAIDRVYDQPMNCACDGDEKLISSEGSAVGNDVGFGEEQ